MNSNLSNLPTIDKHKNDSMTSILKSSELDQDNYDHNLGKFIDHQDLFKSVYTQPVLRANPRDHPEQPFLPNQLVRKEVLRGAANILIDEELIGSGATVQLKVMNQHDRGLVNRWWNDQL